MARLKSGKGRSLSVIQSNVDKLNGGGDGGGGKISGLASRLDVWQLPSMTEAAKTIGRRMIYIPQGGQHKAAKDAWLGLTATRCMGDTTRSAANLALSDELIEKAIQADPRLARRSRWHRTDDGEIGCPALIAAGDDAPYFCRHRSQVSEAAGGESVRIVVSTDANEIAPGTAAAFIATIRLVQQWRSVEVWWQGAWLNPDRAAGWVFHVPLVQGDMDYTRIDYCIGDQTRDNLSYAIMMTRACEVTKCSWNGCTHPAARSYLGEPGTSHFVAHTGIPPNPRTIAFYAAHWLGW